MFHKKHQIITNIISWYIMIYNTIYQLDAILRIYYYYIWFGRMNVYPSKYMYNKSIHFYMFCEKFGDDD